MDPKNPPPPIHIHTAPPPCMSPCKVTPRGSPIHPTIHYTPLTNPLLTHILHPPGAAQCYPRGQAPPEIKLKGGSVQHPLQHHATRHAFTPAHQTLKSQPRARGFLCRPPSSWLDLWPPAPCHNGPQHEYGVILPSFIRGGQYLPSYSQGVFSL